MYMTVYIYTHVWEKCEIQLQQYSTGNTILVIPTVTKSCESGFDLSCIAWQSATQNGPIAIQVQSTKES